MFSYYCNRYSCGSCCCFFYTIIVTHSGSYCDGCLVYTKKSTSINRVRCHQQILSYLQHKTSKTQKKTQTTNMRRDTKAKTK